MKKIFVVTAILLSAISINAREYEWYKTIKNVKGVVQKVMDDTWVIVPEGSGGNRYYSEQLPDEYKKDSLHVTFSGMVGKIPPNVRMVGTPLKLQKISVSKKEMKKFGLKERCYCTK